MVSISDVAKEAGVGKATVSRAINGTGYVSKENKEKIEKAIKKLDYVPNEAARNLKTNYSHNVAVFVPTISHPFFCSIIEYLENDLYQAGYRLIVVSSQNQIEKENNVINLLKQRKVDGLIFMTHERHKALNVDLPIVTIDRHIKGIPCVTSDNFDATYNAIKRLIDMGAKNIAFIGGKPHVESEVTLRRDAYIKAMEDAKLPLNIFFEEVEHGDEIKLVDEMFSVNQKWDAIFATSDVIALTCYNILNKKGISIPSQTKIIAYDGIMSNWISHPTLSCIKQDLAGMSKKIVEQLIKKIKGKEIESKSIVKTTFVEGETI